MSGITSDLWNHNRVTAVNFLSKSFKQDDAQAETTFEQPQLVGFLHNWLKYEKYVNRKPTGEKLRTFINANESYPIIISLLPTEFQFRRWTMKSEEWLGRFWKGDRFPGSRSSWFLFVKCFHDKYPSYKCEKHSGLIPFPADPISSHSWILFSSGTLPVPTSQFPPQKRTGWVDHGHVMGFA